jgi:hypothetical protein
MFSGVRGTVPDTTQIVDMDQQCLNAMVVARGLLGRGTVALDGTAPSAIAAVILYDVAVETAAKATLRVRPLPTVFPGTGYAIPTARRATQQKEHLPWVLDQLLASYRELRADDQVELPALRDSRALHEYRNMVHHQGTVPSPQDLERQRFRATDFITALVASFFGRQLSELSRAMLVQDKEVRDAIMAAEQSLADGHLATAVQRLSIAFEVARLAFRLGQPFDSKKSLDIIQVRGAMRELGRGLQALSPGKRPAVDGLASLQRLLETLVRRSERAEDRLEALSLGAQASDYLWFQIRFPRAYRTLGSSQWETSPRSNHTRVRFTPEEVIRGLDFVTTVALHWQQFPTAPDGELEPD